MIEEKQDEFEKKLVNEKSVDDSEFAEIQAGIHEAVQAMKAGIDEQIKKLWEALNKKSEKLNLRIDTVHTLIENKAEELNDRIDLVDFACNQKLEKIEENTINLRVGYTVAREDFDNEKKKIELNNQEYIRSVQAIGTSVMQHDESLVNMLDRLVVIEDAQQEILNRIAINNNVVENMVVNIGDDRLISVKNILDSRIVLTSDEIKVSVRILNFAPTFKLLSYFKDYNWRNSSVSTTYYTKLYILLIYHLYIPFDRGKLFLKNGYKFLFS